MKKIYLITSLFLIGMTLVSSHKDVTLNTYKVIKQQPTSYEGKTLVIFNCEDYISKQDESDEDYNDPMYDLIGTFEEKYGCTVRYYTYSTNEEMYNQLTLQKEGTYDLICPSEYMIQKLINEDLILPMDKDSLGTYLTHANKNLLNKLDSMKAVKKNADGSLSEKIVGDYCAGYMWGTMGIVYDPQYIDEDDVKSWDIFWDSKYNNMASIKNSMRDTYVVGVLHAYQEELEAAKNNPNMTPEEYNAILQEVFDRHDDQTIELVKEELIALKENIYGFEVDSGKNDIITGKIKMNLAWSGDAVYSIGQAAEDANKYLKYSVPEEGSNIWYDGWVLPKGADTELAYEFINFLSDPSNAAINMDYIGYTPFITSDDVFNLVASWYGAPEFCMDTTYEIDSVVHYESNFYTCIQESTNNLPTDENYFELLEEDLPLNEGVDLSYYFEREQSSSSQKYIIYPYEECANQLETQYPTIDIINRCAFMNDFGEDNSKVIIMWGQVKAATNMVPYYVIIILVVVFVPCYFLIKLIRNKSIELYASKRKNTK